MGLGFFTDHDSRAGGHWFGYGHNGAFSDSRLIPWRIMFLGFRKAISLKISLSESMTCGTSSPVSS